MKSHFNPYQINMNTLGFYIDRLLFTMVKRQNQLLKEAGSDLQSSEFITLKVLNAIGEVNQSQLASVMGKERSGISRILNSLEKKGYIKKEPKNGSTNIVSLSEKGEATFERLKGISDELTDLAFRGFSDKNRKDALNYLDKMYQNALLG